VPNQTLWVGWVCRRPLPSEVDLLTETRNLLSAQQEGRGAP
jgi:hypothetical protein